MLYLLSQTVLKRGSNIQTFEEKDTRRILYDKIANRHLNKINEARTLPDFLSIILEDFVKRCWQSIFMF